MSKINIQLEEINKLRYEQAPDKYILSPELESAVKVSLTLGQPLMLTGEPGTGKTQLAYKVAHDLHQRFPEQFLPEPLVFNTKTTSSAADIFYLYDAIRHFHDANLNKQSGKPLEDVFRYVRLQALGQAILLTNAGALRHKQFSEMAARGPKSSVVLIDEIDKAPRDFPNDILNEIERFEFEIREADNFKVEKGPEHHVVVIMTSNSEKNLPDAFLRRCVFYNIPFPGKEQLMEIIRRNVKVSSDLALESMIEFFLEIRAVLPRKKPATAELLAWLKILELEGFLQKGAPSIDDLTAQQKNMLETSFSVLAKTTEDLQKLREKYL